MQVRFAPAFSQVEGGEGGVQGTWKVKEQCKKNGYAAVKLLSCHAFNQT
jgi:hypothetical protein